ncbi:MAG: TerB family tellurite resistance protein [Alphaproteobacteria bacterium]|nr:MAG: TerB family tellurite resistance protein [Alphaproteobacteria bacterium]
MLGDLLRMLTGRAAPQDEAEAAPLALAALLVRVARADGSYDAREKVLIDRLLARRFGLGPEAAAALRSRAEALETEAPDSVRFTRALKEAVPYEERAGLVEDLWAVVLADGRRDHEEDGFMRLAAQLLGLTDRESAEARRRVERGNR